MSNRIDCIRHGDMPGVCSKCYSLMSTDFSQLTAELAALKAEIKEAGNAGYAQGVEITEARASKRIAELEADYERVQKLSSDAGSKGHALKAEKLS